MTSFIQRGATSTLDSTAARRGLLIAVLAFVALNPSPACAYSGAVASPDRYGADTAEEVLKAGGNAVDAAVAMAFTLAVTYPEAGNLGGGGFATVYFRGKAYFLDYRERAPAAATATMYLDSKGEVVPDASTVGVRAAAVPGTVKGLWQLHRRFGALPWRRLLQPAIRYARDGFVASEMLSQQSADTVKSLAGRTNFEAYFGAIKPAATLRQVELAATLERIALHGTHDFYQGETARLIIAQMARGHGLMTAKDLAAYQAIWRTPLESDWAGYRIITAPPPSSGGIALISLLKMKAIIAPLFAGVTLNSPQYVHLLAEIEKPVFADRAEYLGDPDFQAVPIAPLLADEYLSARARRVSPERPTATEAVTPGLAEHHNTTHFSVVDRFGNAVSNTYTLNDDFGAGEVVERAGFLLNNEMDDFSVKAGSPNLYGVVGGEANAIAPGKTPLSSMTPTILTRDGQVALVIGTPGGSRIFTSVFQVITNWHDFGLPLGQAVAAPRVHHQLLPKDTIFEEPYGQVDAATRQALEARGYHFENQGWNGDIEAIEVAARGTFAAADPRGIGVARVLD